MYRAARTGARASSLPTPCHPPAAERAAVAGERSDAGDAAMRCRFSAAELRHVRLSACDPTALHCQALDRSQILRLAKGLCSGSSAGSDRDGAELAFELQRMCERIPKSSPQGSHALQPIGSVD